MLPLVRGARRKDNRLFFVAIGWIIPTGCPWRDLPLDLLLRADRGYDSDIFGQL